MQAVADLAADFYADFNITNWLYTRSLLNNHRTKSAGALGLALLLFRPDRELESTSDIEALLRIADLFCTIGSGTAD